MPSERKTTKWAWRANSARLRSLEAKGLLLTITERQERDRIRRWFAAHDEPKPMSASPCPRPSERSKR
jgi:hypothetical protein